MLCAEGFVQVVLRFSLGPFLLAPSDPCDGRQHIWKVHFGREREQKAAQLCPDVTRSGRVEIRAGG
jgi:hypothetical protein